MLSTNFRCTHLPYCLVKQTNGTYVAINRHQQPIGCLDDGYVNYDEHPVAVNIKGLTPGMARKLSWNGSSDTNCIYLYNDACTPGSSTKNMNAFLKKLRLLAKLRIVIE